METRSNVILNHPDVIGFVYLNENNVTKAFLPKKHVNFTAATSDKSNIIVAVSGEPEEYTPFSVPEDHLFSDCYHLIDCNNPNKNTPSISVSKFIKDNEDELKLQKSSYQILKQKS